MLLLTCGRGSGHLDLPILCMRQYVPRKTGLHRAPPGPLRPHARTKAIPTRQPSLYPPNERGPAPNSASGGRPPWDGPPSTCEGSGSTEGSSASSGTFDAQGHPYTNFKATLRNKTQDTQTVWHLRMASHYTWLSGLGINR